MAVVTVIKRFSVGDRESALPFKYLLATLLIALIHTQLIALSKEKLDKNERTKFRVQSFAQNTVRRTNSSALT